MSDRLLPGLGFAELAASTSISRRALVEPAFRAWVTSRVYRHLCCDWGIVPPSVADANFASVVLGGPVISRWPFEGDALVILHTSDQSQATVMLESEQPEAFSGPKFQEV